MSVDVVTKLNALRRLTMRPHAESPGHCKHKEYRIRLYDGDYIVGYVGLTDLIEAKLAIERMMSVADLQDAVVRQYPVD